jgi:predicted MFS family arabinose efflux permease
LIALFSILGEPGWRTVAVASLSAPLPAVVLVVTGVGYVLGQSLATRALRRVGFKSLAIIVQFTSALSFAAGALMAANDVVLIGSRAVAAISAATLVSAWWHARNAAAEQANSPKGLLIPGNPLAMVLPFAPIATTFAAASSFAPTFAALALVALIAALLSLVLPSNALDTRHSASPQLSRTPSRAVFAMEYLPLDAMQVALTAIAAAHVLNLSVTPSDVTIPYVGLCLVGLALAAGGLLPARHGQRSIFIVALTAIALTAPAGLALQLGTSLTPEILEVLSASSLSLVAACALAIPRSKDSAAGGNGRAGIGRTISATGFGLIGAVVILEVEMINAVQPETWVFVSVACALVWRLMAPARRPASQ